MYLAIIALPLFSSILSGLFGRFIGVTGSKIISVTCLISAALLSIVCFVEVSIYGSPVYIHLFKWIDSELLVVDWSLWFDSLSMAMLSMVLTVSSMVHLYTCYYIAEDPHNQRFFSYLPLFTFGICLLVAGGNYLVMFVGWEMIGVVSFLLISFWTTRREANKSALQAFIINRVGDMFLSISFFIMFWACGSLDYSVVFSVAPLMNETTLTIIGLCFLAGAAGKSSQIFLHSWLPNAIEGPTPVSSMIHAATLVTAGVYLLMRSSPLLEYAPTALLVAVWLGSLSFLFAATCALVTTDLKRTIAFSTISQMGYLVIACGLSQWNVALFHLVNHGFFKALLFLSAGGILHAFLDIQDMRRLGGIVNFIPFTYTVLLIGSISLCAFPFLTGFYSKDLIIELGFGCYSLSGSIVYYLGGFIAILTAFYSFRLISITFISYPNSSKSSYELSHEGPYLIIIPLVVLGLLAIFFGYLAKDLYVGIGSDFLSSALFTHPDKIALVETEFSIPTFFKLLPMIGTLLGAILGIVIYHGLALDITEIALSKVGRPIYTFFVRKWNYDSILNHFILFSLRVGEFTVIHLDRGTIELVGPHGLATYLYKGSSVLNKMDTGLITDYSLGIMISILSIGLILFYPVYIGNSNSLIDPALIFVYIGAIFVAIAERNSDINTRNIVSSSYITPSSSSV